MGFGVNTPKKRIKKFSDIFIGSVNEKWLFSRSGETVVEIDLLKYFENHFPTYLEHVKIDE